MSSLEIGLRFCGIVEDAPRPGMKGSETSPSSVAIISMTSVAISASELVTRPRKVTTSAIPSRVTCGIYRLAGGSGNGVKHGIRLSAVHMFGTAAMCAVFRDEALVGGCLDAEAALARAQAGLGTYLVPRYYPNKTFCTNKIRSTCLLPLRCL